MPKEKKNPLENFRRTRAKPEPYPGKATRDRLPEVVTRLLEATPLLELKKGYTGLEKAGIVRFQEYMERLMREAQIMDDQWQQARSKPAFEDWLKNVATDATWNVMVEVGRRKKRGAVEDDNLFKQV